MRVTSRVGPHLETHKLSYTPIRQALLTVALALAPGVALAATPLKTVTVVGSNTTLSISGGYYTSIPEATGFWTQEGIKVDRADVGGSTEAMQSILAGKADIGIIGSSTVFTVAQRGQPLKGIFATVTDQYIWPAVLPNSPIKTLADLKGKMIGVPSLESATLPNARAFVKLGGGDPDAVQFLSVGTGADAMIALQHGDVDALMLWDGPYAEIEARGQKLRYLMDSDVAKEAGYKSELVVDVTTIPKKADLFVAYARAVAKSIVFMKANPDCAVKAHWAIYPQSRPMGVPMETAMNQAKMSWQSRAVNVSQNDGKWGFNTNSQIAANRPPKSAPSSYSASCGSPRTSPPDIPASCLVACSSGSRSPGPFCTNRQSS